MSKHKGSCHAFSFAFFLAIGSLAAATAQDCPTRTSCSNCFQVMGCHWCAAVVNIKTFGVDRNGVDNGLGICQPTTTPCNVDVFPQLRPVFTASFDHSEVQFDTKDITNFVGSCVAPSKVHMGGDCVNCPSANKWCSLAVFGQSTTGNDASGRLGGICIDAAESCSNIAWDLGPVMELLSVEVDRSLNMQSNCDTTLPEPPCYTRQSCGTCASTTARPTDCHWCEPWLRKVGGAEDDNELPFPNVGRCQATCSAADPVWNELKASYEQNFTYFKTELFLKEILGDAATCLLTIKLPMWLVEGLDCRGCDLMNRQWCQTQVNAVAVSRSARGGICVATRNTCTPPLSETDLKMLSPNLSSQSFSVVCGSGERNKPCNSYQTCDTCIHRQPKVCDFCDAGMEVTRGGTVSRTRVWAATGSFCAEIGECNSQLNSVLWEQGEKLVDVTFGDLTSKLDMRGDNCPSGESSVHAIPTARTCETCNAIDGLQWCHTALYDLDSDKKTNSGICMTEEEVNSYCVIRGEGKNMVESVMFQPSTISRRLFGSVIADDGSCDLEPPKKDGSAAVAATGLLPLLFSAAALFFTA